MRIGKPEALAKTLKKASGGDIFITLPGIPIDRAYQLRIWDKLPTDKAMKLPGHVDSSSANLLLEVLSADREELFWFACSLTSNTVTVRSPIEEMRDYNVNIWTSR